MHFFKTETMNLEASEKKKFCNKEFIGVEEERQAAKVNIKYRILQRGIDQLYSPGKTCGANEKLQPH